MPLADRAGHDLAIAEAVLVQEARQRLEYQQRRATVVLRLCEGLDDVICGDWCGHGREPYKDRNLPCAEVSVATMSRISRALTTLLAGALLAGAAGAAPALADHSQTNFFEASNELLVPSARAHTFQTLEHLGVKALRVELYWYDVAPDPTSATRPNFEGTNPARYDWSLYDPILAEAQRLHWPVLLTVTAPAPRWATANRQAPYITRPDPKDFQELMTAVALHYGSQVSLYSIWNEPNHPAFLLPQFNANGTPASPRIYRGLYQAAYAGLQAAELAHPRILFGETAPTGFDRVNVRREGTLHDVAPLEFMREALCLNAHYRKSPSCGSCR